MSPTSVHGARFAVFSSRGQPASSARAQPGVWPAAIELPLPSVHTKKPPLHTHNKGYWTRSQVYSGAHCKPSSEHGAPIVSATVAGHWPAIASAAVAASVCGLELWSEFPQATFAAALRVERPTAAKAKRLFIRTLA